MANNKQQRQNLQKRNRRVNQLKASKGGIMKTMKKGSKNERAVDQHTGSIISFMFGGSNPIYSPPHKKLKGYQRDHTGKKVA